MSSYVERLAILALSACLMACPGSHVCEGPELCNGRDDDCDGKQDEDFEDAQGRLTSPENCGRCGVSCDAVFTSARETTCDASETVPMCRILSCDIGFHLAGDGACVPDAYVLCLPCTADSDCATRTPDARCIQLASERRCGLPCGPQVPCPSPFACDAVSGQCLPEAALCKCDKVDATFQVACLGEGSAPSVVCAGFQTCSPAGLGACTIATEESCNLADDDCDGEIDEGFRDTTGRYIGRLHCGACGATCAPPGENYLAECVPTGVTARCDVACEPGFVDVDGIAGNGCECERFDGTTAPRAVGGDANCDGDVDDNDLFVHVSAGGSDSGLGTLVAPLRTIDAGSARAKAERKLVLVAQGSYPPFRIAAGVSVFGGYRTDFQDRNPELYRVVIEAGASSDGAPVLTCEGVTQASVIDGVTLVGSDALTIGQGSTVARFDRCGPAVKLAHVTVLSARGANGVRGDDASARLPAGLSSLADLDGVDGRPGAGGDAVGETCVARFGASGGTKQCGAVDVTGGVGGASTCGGTGCVSGRPCGNAGCTDFTVGGVCDYRRVLAQAVANPPATNGRGSQGGLAGALTYNAVTNRNDCAFCDDNPTLERLGQDGSDGRPGGRGTGGEGCTNGPLLFDPFGRASASMGSAGVAGNHGSGGGGGSAGSGYDVITGVFGGCTDHAGGSGAGAGSGGCGAPSGGAGGGGGASLGLAVQVTASGEGPSFESVRVVTASGGRGGEGGIGAAGGVGGAGGLGGSGRFWCARNGGRGGEGGAGGAGGGGGGGCGGSSHGLVLLGPASSSYRAAATNQLTVSQTGVAGQGGAGGFSPGVSGAPGNPGLSTSVR